MRHLLLAILLSLWLAVPAQAREWLRAETPHFTIYSDGYPMELERWAKKLEWFDQILRREIGAKSARPVGEPLTVYLLEDAKAVQQVTGQRYLAGIYYQSSEGPFLIANRKPGYRKEELSGQATLFHEYAHHFMYRNSTAAYPAWYREGFAEYVSTVAFDIDRHYTFGAPTYHRLKQLKKRDVAVNTLLNSEVDDIEAKHRANFYAWSWLLTHLLKSDPARPRQLDAYLAAFARGASPEQAAQVFGDLDALEQQLRTYAETDLLYRRSREPLGETPEVKAEALGPVGSQLLELHLARQVGQSPDEALGALRQLAAAHPGNADVLAELAALELRMALATRDLTLLDEADAAIDRALATDPAHPVASVLKAQSAMQRSRITGGKAAIDWRAIRQRLVNALRADPDNALAMAELFRTHLSERSRPSPFAYAAIERAFALQPETGRIRTLYAISLGLRGRFDEAKALAQVLVSDPHRTVQGTRALATLRRMEAASRVPDEGEIE
ncbi:MAG: hypothetical protein R3D89_08870 [Sphingomonadaceae bacterium]